MINEPYVSLKEIVINNPSVANIDETSLMAGVINAPCGPDHMLINGPKDFLKYFTVGGSIPRNADDTLVNAYYCSFFAPILVKRAWTSITDDPNIGKVVVQSCSNIKSGDHTISDSYVLPTNLPVSSVSASTDSIAVSMKYPIDYINSDKKGAVHMVVGITTVDDWNTTKSSKFSHSGYSFESGEITNNELAVVYWYDSNHDSGDNHDPEYSGFKLVSLSTYGIDPLTESSVYWEDQMDDESIPFVININTNSISSDTNIEFGVKTETNSYNLGKPSTKDYTDALKWIENNSDVYNISYLNSFGKDGYETELAITANINRWFYFCDIKDNEATADAINIKLGADNYRVMVGGSADKNSSVTPWRSTIYASSLYWQRVYANKAANSEFAPVFDMTNGTLSAQKPLKELNKSKREDLLRKTYPINWIKYDRTDNVYYLNDNRTHTRKQNVMNEEMNVRMINKIQRDVMLLVKKYKGMINNDDTRLDVYGLIDDYMKRYIMNQNFRPVEYRIVCDRTNNTDELINANKLAIELDVRLQGSIKFIEVINKVFPLGVAFEQ